MGGSEIVCVLGSMLNHYPPSPYSLFVVGGDSVFLFCF